jgi:hypothetical protein
MDTSTLCKMGVFVFPQAHATPVVVFGGAPRGIKSSYNQCLFPIDFYSNSAIPTSLILGHHHLRTWQYKPLSATVGVRSTVDRSP